MTDKTTLRALALAATQGPWAVNPDDREGMEWNNEIVLAENRDMRVCFMANAHSKETADFIAAANPQTVLKRLDEIEALRVALTKIKEEATTIEAMKAPARALGQILFIANEALSGSAAQESKGL